jgi:2-methylcitrate dehydratase PrpD
MDAPDPPYAVRLARLAARTEPADLPAPVRTAVGRALADTLAAVVAGAGTPAGERLRAYVAATGADAGPATVVGGDRSLPHLAALANGTAAHALETDDGHRGGSVHPGSPVVPAALAVAEREGATGAELATAVALGYEAVVRVAESIQPGHRERGFHATATCGPFGAALAAARLAGLDADATADALGLAGTQAGGLFEFLAAGSMAKRFHAGRAAMAGVQAADLAAAGVDGPHTILGGRDGFLRAFGDAVEPAPLDSPGLDAVCETYLKPFPCCRHLHGPIECALDLRDRLDPAAVESVRVETYPVAAHHDATTVETVLDAQMSLPYALATALLAGDASLECFDPPRTDGPVAALARRVEVVATDEMTARYPAERPARVVVRTAEGEHDATVGDPPGSPTRPLDEDRLRAKLRDLTAALPDADRERLLEGALDPFDLADATVLAGAAAGATPRQGSPARGD